MIATIDEFLWLFGAIFGMLRSIKMKDYRVSHASERKSLQYEEVIYRQDSYDDFLWRAEQNILRKEFSRLSPGMRYLDFACGTGRILQLGEGYVGDSVGIDIAPEMLDIARTKVKHSRLVAGDLTQRDYFSEELFDMITAFRFFLNAQPSLREEGMNVLASKLHDKNSTLIFNMQGNLWRHRLGTKIWFWLRGHRLNTSSYRQSIQLVHAHGLEVIRWYGFGWVPKVFYRIFNPRIMFALDHKIAKIPGARYVAYDLVFVCRRKSDFA